MHLEALECFLNGLHGFAHQVESKRVQNFFRALLRDVAGRKHDHVLGVELFWTNPRKQIWMNMGRSPSIFPKLKKLG